MSARWCVAYDIPVDETCPQAPWCGRERNLPPSALPDPEQLDLFSEEDE